MGEGRQVEPFGTELVDEQREKVVERVAAPQFIGAVGDDEQERGGAQGTGEDAEEVQRAVTVQSRGANSSNPGSPSSAYAGTESRGNELARPV